MKASEAAARDCWSIVNWHDYGHRGACLTVFRRLLELYMARQATGYKPSFKLAQAVNKLLRQRPLEEERNMPFEDPR
jgi:hypothetical protein